MGEENILYFLGAGTSPQTDRRVVSSLYPLGGSLIILLPTCETYTYARTATPAGELALNGMSQKTRSVVADDGEGQQRQGGLVMIRSHKLKSAQDL